MQHKGKLVELIPLQILTDALSILSGLAIDASTPLKEPLPPLCSENNHGARYATHRPEHLLLDAELARADAHLKQYIASGMPKLALFARGGYGRPAEYVRS